VFYKTISENTKQGKKKRDESLPKFFDSLQSVCDKYTRMTSWFGSRTFQEKSETNIISYMYTHYLVCPNDEWSGRPGVIYDRVEGI